MLYKHEQEEGSRPDIEVEEYNEEGEGTGEGTTGEEEGEGEEGRDADEEAALEALFAIGVLNELKSGSGPSDAQQQPMTGVAAPFKPRGEYESFKKW